MIAGNPFLLWGRVALLDKRTGYSLEDDIMIFKFHRKNTLMTGKEEADIDASIAKTASAECAATDAPSNPATQPQADEVPGPPNRAIGSMDILINNIRCIG